MYQVNFSDQSISELNKLELTRQMELVEKISSLTPEELKNPREPLGKFNRDGKTFYRLRAGDFRCYFEIKGNILYSHYFLYKNSLADFIFRTKLPLSEQQMVEQHQSFWKYLDSLKREEGENKL